MLLKGIDSVDLPGQLYKLYNSVRTLSNCQPARSEYKGHAPTIRIKNRQVYTTDSNALALLLAVFLKLSFVENRKNYRWRKECNL